MVHVLTPRVFIYEEKQLPFWLNSSVGFVNLKFSCLDDSVNVYASVNVKSPIQRSKYINVFPLCIGMRSEKLFLHKLDIFYCKETVGMKTFNVFYSHLKK